MDKIVHVYPGIFSKGGGGGGPRLKSSKKEELGQYFIRRTLPGSVPVNVAIVIETNMSMHRAGHCSVTF